MQGWKYWNAGARLGLVGEAPISVVAGELDVPPVDLGEEEGIPGWLGRCRNAREMGGRYSMEIPDETCI